ncbi:MAG: glycerophosphodiester phosphodiesterase [Proteobacteria bacterium]|nr:glycerophosphodiester phosphodiesterase [Pseudomonadota bacterium]
MAGWAWPALVVHRCGGALAPENTLAGLEIAARLGCRAVEFDVMLSADGQPLLIHDETLDRTAARPGRVAELDAVELLEVDVGRHFHPAYADETIPAFGAALERCRRLRLAANVEIKPAIGKERQTGQVVGRCLRGIDDGADGPQVLLSSFSVEALEAAIEEVPQWPRALLVSSYSPAALAMAQSLSCVALNLSREGLTEADVSAVREAGLAVMVYTVNAFDEARRLLDWGVAGVFSDRPDCLAPLATECCNT